MCPFCSSKKTNFWFDYPLDIKINTYPIFKCRDCKSAFVYPPPSEESLSKYYSSDLNGHIKNFQKSDLKNLESVMLEEKIYPNATVDATRIAKTLKKLSTGNRMLDVGSGNGFFSNAAQKFGFDIQAIELNEQSRKIFKLMNGFEAHSSYFNLEFAERYREKFDVVLLSQVLEHIPIDQNPILNISTLLKPGGICAIAVPHFRSFISVIQGKNDMFISPPEHVNYFTIVGLNALFLGNGFECIKVETISRFDKNKIANQFKNISPIITKLLSILLNIADSNNKGMFINAYYRKIS